MEVQRSGKICFVFFFKQKTAYEIYQCDWSSDVCSSDLTHTYRWTATAKDQNGGTLGTATSEREFPEY